MEEIDMINAWDFLDRVADEASIGDGRGASEIVGAVLADMDATDCDRNILSDALFDEIGTAPSDDAIVEYALARNEHR